MDALNSFDDQKIDKKEVINRVNKELQGIDRDTLLDIMVDIINDVYRDNLPFEIKKEIVNI